MDEIKWRRSTRSGSNGQCVEVAETADRILVLDSKDPDGPVLGFSPAAWQRFIEAVRTGEVNGA